MTAFIDTNILVRHLTGDPPDMADRATRFLAAASEEDLRLADLVLAEAVYVLESFYKAPRAQVAEAARAIVAFPAIQVNDPAMLLRTIEIYETHRHDFADAYLIAAAEHSGIGAVASFDKGIDRVGTIQRLETVWSRGSFTLQSILKESNPRVEILSYRDVRCGLDRCSRSLTLRGPQPSWC